MRRPSSQRNQTTMPSCAGYTSRSHPLRRVVGHAGFKCHHFLLQRDDVFLLLNQHGQQHHLERGLTREIGAGRRMVAGSGEQHIERLLILTPQRTPVTAPRVDLLLDQLRERGKRAPHVYNRFQSRRGIIQRLGSSPPSSWSHRPSSASRRSIARRACARSVSTNRLRPPDSGGASGVTHSTCTPWLAISRSASVMARKRRIASASGTD